MTCFDTLAEAAPVPGMRAGVGRAPSPAGSDGPSTSARGGRGRRAARRGLVAVLAAAALLPGAAFAELRVRAAPDGGPDVALFRTETAMDLPGGASVINRLEMQCSGGRIYYITVDFGTPRISQRTATRDLELEQHFSSRDDPSDERWRIDYDLLAGQADDADAPRQLKNLQLNRMLYLGDHQQFLERLLDADYLAVERPAVDGPGFVFELSHLQAQRERLSEHCMT